jgi:hypothetical protein
MFRHKSDTIATVLQTSSQNMTFKQDLTRSRLAACNARLERLALVQLLQGTDEFQ